MAPSCPERQGGQKNFSVRSADPEIILNWERPGRVSKQLPDQTANTGTGEEYAPGGRGCSKLE
ncbi:hypothetical protein GCM10027256_10700 [Novispirillum itersonii subsp. nipponicum]